MRVEKRKTPRVEINAVATMQLLGTTPEGNGNPFPVRVVDASERGMKLQAGQPMDAGQPVRVEFGEAMFLGEVCYCAPAGDGAGESYYLGVITQECLTGLSSLHHLIHALRPEPAEKLERV
jgi:hypothetical protein